jgi:hypothetical protein
VVGRVLEHGDLRDIRFLAGVLGTEELLQLAAAVRFSSKKAAGLWRSMRELEGTGCVKRPSRPALKAGSLRRAVHLPRDL